MSERERREGFFPRIEEGFALPITSTPFDFFSHLRSLFLEREETVVLVTVVESKGSTPQITGARMAVFPDGEILGTVGGGRIEARILDEVEEFFQSNKKSRLINLKLREVGMSCGGVMSFFIEKVEPPPHAVIFGAGHVAQPTAYLAYLAGFRVTVVDPRPEWANSTRFPHAEVVNSPYVDFLESWTPREHHYILSITQGHAYDLEILKRVIRGKQRYLGVIGSKRKAVQLKKDLLAAGFDESDWERVRCPIGLPIGGSHPNEIAVSIAAQLIETRHSQDSKK